MIKQAKTRPDDLKERVIAAKRKFPPYMPYIPAYEEMFGSMSLEEKTKVRNVWNLRIVDEVITMNLENLAEAVK